MKIVKETENLYRLTRLSMVNCFLVREDDGLTLIDANLPGSAETILRVAAELRSKIRTILLTHAHFDHTSSVDDLMAALPGVELLIGEREQRLLAGDKSLEPGESGKRLLGFPKVSAKSTRVLSDGDWIGSLQAISCPGHTPGHMAFRDARDNSLIAGDSFVTQTGLVAAGVFSIFFPLPAWFSWNGALAAESAAKLGALRPSLLCVGHGKSLVSPLKEMDRAIAVAFQQHPRRNSG
jgi:glyoxylase-like metal-dependent hydrolase (beta-lactamase superfamily II)